MRANGVTVKMPDEEIHADVDAYHLCDIATFTEPFDVVLMLFKAYDTRWAAELIKPHLAEDGLLIGVQNGMTAETIADVVGPETHPALRHRAGGRTGGPGRGEAPLAPRPGLMVLRWAASTRRRTGARKKSRSCYAMWARWRSSTTYCRRNG